MYGSQAMSKDLNLPFPASPFRLAKDEIDLTHHPNHQHGHHHPQQQEQQQHPQMSSGGGFLRYRSAPNTVMGEYCEEFLPNRASGHEEEPMYARFMAPDLRDLLGEKQGASAAPPVAPSEVASPHMLFQLHQQQQSQQQQQPPVTLPNISASTPVAATAAENLFRPMSSMAMEQQQEHPKGHASSSLIRHSSSPAGLFSHLNVDNGFASMSAAADPSGSASSSSRLKGPQLGFSPRHGTASFMSQISEMGSDGMGGSPDGEDGSGGGGGGAARCYIPGYPVATWDESASLLLGDGLHPGGRRPRDPSELQNGELRGHPHLGGNLAHHLSLPAPGRAAEMASVERFLQFQDAVPCKLRAKRGCATHPRSIAERVRRTRISERMRKLQELVPNMDKQTNTADMLDLAVEYIKELERQAKVLSESRAKCTCSAASAHRNNNHQ